MFQIPTRFNKANILGDRSASLWFSSGLEIDQETNDILFQHMNLEGWTVFSENKIPNAEIPKGDVDLNRKSASQRLRGVLYIQIKQKLGRDPNNDEWTEYYNAKMEAIIIKEKEVLE